MRNFLLWTFFYDTLFAIWLLGRLHSNSIKYIKQKPYVLIRTIFAKSVDHVKPIYFDEMKYAQIHVQQMLYLIKNRL